MVAGTPLTTTVAYATQCIAFLLRIRLATSREWRGDSHFPRVLFRGAEIHETIRHHARLDCAGYLCCRLRWWRRRSRVVNGNSPEWRTFPLSGSHEGDR